MNAKSVENEDQFDESKWFSSYGMITANRIIDRYGIVLDNRDLLHALKFSECFFYKLIRLPLRNMLNDVIRQQVYDYVVYAQKLFVDYLLSGETTKPATSQGGYTREELEGVRQRLVTLCKEFQETEYKHFRLIAQSQRHIIQHTKHWQQNFIALTNELRKNENVSIGQKRLLQLCGGVLCYVSLNADNQIMKNTLKDLIKRYESVNISDSTQEVIIQLCQNQAEEAQSILSSLQSFSDQTETMYQQMRHYRKEITEIIIKANELIRVLPEYHLDNTQNEKNKEDLYFDSHLGEKENV